MIEITHYWSDEEKQALRTAARDGLTAHLAAIRLTNTFRRKFTRNAVLGQAKRLSVRFGSAREPVRATP